MFRYLFFGFILVWAMLFLFSYATKAQSVTPVFTVYSGFDSLQSGELDTIPMRLEYYDSTTRVGVRTIKVNGVYKNFTYRLPKYPERKWMWGFCVRRRGAGESKMILNDETGTYHCFDCGQYLDEIKQPLDRKYKVTLTTAENAPIFVPD